MEVIEQEEDDHCEYTEQECQYLWDWPLSVEDVDEDTHHENC